MIAGVLSLRLKYVFMIGAFALLLDADHLLQFFNVEMISRMVHSVPFAINYRCDNAVCFWKKRLSLGSHLIFCHHISHIAFDVWFVGQIYPGSTSGFHYFLLLQLKLYDSRD